MERFKIGDKVYFAKCANERKKITCPICFGKLSVTLILGDDSEVILPCNYCGKGFDEPLGFIYEYDYAVDAELVLIDGIEIKKSLAGEEYYYRSGCYGYKQNQLFLTKEEALKKAKTLKTDLDKEQETRNEYLKKDKSKGFSWNAGYHSREAKRLKREIEYHEKNAILCKERSRKEGVKQ